MARQPCFYESYSSTSSSERLKIPIQFTSHLESRVSGSVILRGPSGNIWYATLSQKGETIFFERGWETFLKDHLIECGDLLIFRYLGNLHFSVQVFDQSACEKESAFNSKCSDISTDLFESKGNKREREENNSSLNVYDYGICHKMTRWSSQVYAEKRDKNQDLGDNEDEVFDGVNAIERNPVTELYNKESEPQSNNSYYGNGDQEAPIQVGNRKIGVLVLPAQISTSMLSARDEKKVAQCFTSSVPYFVRIMKSFNISGSYTLNIPYQFSMGHLPNCKIKIVLHNLKGECWTVNSIPTTRVHTSHTFCGGWMAFVRDNDIKFGDICIFELVGDCELQVQIFSVEKDSPDCQKGKCASIWSSSGHDLKSCTAVVQFPKNLREKCSELNSKCSRNNEKSDEKWSKMSSDVVFSVETKKHCKTSRNFMKATSSSPSKVGNKKLVKTATQRRHRIEDDLSSQAKTGLRMLFSLDERRLSESFSSSFPNFVKIMKKFNVSGSYTLKIPHQFSAAHLPNYKIEIILRNVRSECWVVNCVPDTKGRMLHTFCGGWMAFVRDNDINFGDACIFELVEKCEMRVYISGVGKEGLDHQDLDAKNNKSAIVPSTTEKFSFKDR